MIDSREEHTANTNQSVRLLLILFSLACITQFASVGWLYTRLHQTSWTLLKLRIVAVHEMQALATSVYRLSGALNDDLGNHHARPDAW
jgi:hypothetical protein